MNFMRWRRQRVESHCPERGYALLVLLLVIAILTIGFLEAAKYDLEYTAQQIKREREEELIHRGVQYSRAIRRYFKAFGRYPTRIEDLDSTNNIRFLRKRYKDPITGKDFKLLRMADVQFGLTAQIVQTPVRPPGPQPGTEKNGEDAQDSADSGTPTDEEAQSADPQSEDSPAADSQSDGQSEQSQANASNASGEKTTGSAPAAQQAATTNAPQIFAGGPIVGVASISKAKSIREFNNKDHYNQWQFLYDPSTDSGGLIMTPNQPRIGTPEKSN